MVRSRASSTHHFAAYLIIGVLVLTTALVILSSNTVSHTATSFFNRAAGTSMTPATGNWGNAMRTLSQTRGYLVINNSSSINPKPGLTIEGWMKPEEAWGGKTIADKRSATGELMRLYAGAVDHVTYITMIYSFEVAVRSSNCNVAPVWYQENISPGQLSQWRHLAGVIQPSGEVDLYVNGVRRATQTYDFSQPCTSTNNITVASVNGANTEMAGQLDEIRISNTARYSSDYTPATEPFTTDQNTLVLYHLDVIIKPDTNSKGLTPDSSGNIHPGSVVDEVQLVPSTIGQ